jgi:hypothetical protein
VLFASLNAESRNGSLGYVSHQFGGERLVRPILGRNPQWLGDDGSMLMNNRGQAELLDRYGISRRTFENWPTLLDLAGDRVLTLERDGTGAAALAVVSTDSGERTLLHEADRWGGVIVGADQTRVMAYEQVVDPEDPTAVETVVLCGRP